MPGQYPIVLYGKEAEDVIDTIGISEADKKMESDLTLEKAKWLIQQWEAVEDL